MDVSINGNAVNECLVQVLDGSVVSVRLCEGSVRPSAMIFRSY